MKSILFIFVFLVSSIFGGTLQENRWDSAKVSAIKRFEANQIVDRILANKSRYESVDKSTNVPWQIISSLHNMEASGSFKKHLHEGSLLTGRTRYIPKGRPKTGKPPFTWEYSAIDALNYDKMGEVRWSYLDDTLYAIERYNGTGYLRFHINTPTPYLWAGSSIERPGKYVADNKWSSTARSSQIGVAAILKIMEERGVANTSSLKRK
jgi:lysozyme family protein